MNLKQVTFAEQSDDMEQLDDAVLVDLARHKNELAVRTIVRRHNQRLFRAARSITRNDGDAEDVVQASYVKAFTHLDSFRGDAQLSTWLTRIALNEALGRARRQRPTTGIEQIDIESSRSGGQVILFPTVQAPIDPETEMSRMEVRQLLERAVDELPTAFRAVFVLRDVEGMSIEEAASHLGIKPETVKTRLHRARRLLRAAIEAQMSDAFTALFPFDGARCVSMADRVVAQLRLQD
ncbi:MAG TPA: RNA polymerase sigma factor [Devosia sp.]|nr:RNA polymerase sigma factor [Devosia sp.]